MRNGRFIVVLMLLFSIFSCAGNSKKGEGKVESKEVIVSNLPTFDLVEIKGKGSLSVGGRGLGRAVGGEKLSDRFTLRNKLEEPVVIISITTNCGCIQLSYDKKPIAVDGEMTVSYTYNTAGEIGQQFSELVIDTNKGKYTVYIDLFVK